MSFNDWDDYMDYTLSSCDELDSVGYEKSKERKTGIVIYDSRKDSDGISILKALTVCGLCLGGMFLPVAANAGDFGTALCLLGSVALGIAVLKS